MQLILVPDGMQERKGAWLPSSTTSNSIMLYKESWMQPMPSSKAYPLMASMKGLPEPNKNLSLYLINCTVS